MTRELPRSAGTGHQRRATATMLPSRRCIPQRLRGLACTDSASGARSWRRAGGAGRSRTAPYLLPAVRLVPATEPDTPAFGSGRRQPSPGGIGRVAGVVPDAILGYPSCRTGWSDDVRDELDGRVEPDDARRVVGSSGPGLPDVDGQHRPHADVPVQARGGATPAPAASRTSQASLVGSKPRSESSSADLSQRDVGGPDERRVVP